MTISYISIFGLIAFIALFIPHVTYGRAKRSVACNKRIPLSEYFEHGYDLSEFDVYGCTDVGGKREKFININLCDKGAKFTYNDENKTEYDVPDQFLRAYETGATHLNFDHTYTDIKSAEDDFLRPMAFQSYIDRVPSVEKSFFKHSETYKYIFNVLAKKSHVRTVSYQAATCGLIVNGGTYEKAHFTSGFSNDVNNLPNNFGANRKAYFDFIKKYGTHVFLSAQFGGIITRFSKVPKEIVGTEKEKEIAISLLADPFALNGTLETLCEKKDGIRQTLLVNDKQRNFAQEMIGGFADVNLYKSTSAPVQAFRALPALLSAEIQPISYLIHENDEKQKSVEDAIKIHLAVAYIKSLIYEIETRKKIGDQFPNVKTNELLERFQHNSDRFNYDQLNKLANDFRSLL